MISTSSKSKHTSTTSNTIETHECCMCGDYGFSYELFQCKLCQFRSQHRYCSNLYPNVAESHKICNWCLSQKDQEAKEKSQNSSNSSSSFRNEDDSITKININNHKKNIINSNTKQQQQQQQQQGSNHINNNTSLIVRRQGRVNQLQLSKYGPIKKQRSVEVLCPSPAPATSPAVTTRKRIITNGAKEEAAKRLIRRTRSEDISKTHHHHGIKKQVFRNKVRRYKLLEEVSS